MNIKDLAKEALNYFERIRRGREWGLVDDAPEWVYEVVREGHGEMMPDKWRYDFIHEALEAIAEGNLEGENFETDVYISDLLRWVSSNIGRTEYSDEVLMSTSPVPNSLWEVLTIAQQQEKREVFDLIKAALENALDEQPKAHK